VPPAEIYNAPFEISEAGWGEFEAGIRVFFKDPDEQPIDIPHTIKLYHHQAAGAGAGLPLPLPHLPSKQPVMSEFYDEVVFTDPSQEFRRHLIGYTAPSVRKITDMTEHYSIFSDQEDIRLLTLIQDHLRTEIETSKTKLLRLEGELSAASLGASLPPPGAGAPQGAGGEAPAGGGGGGGGGGPPPSGPGRKRAAAGAQAAAAAAAGAGAAGSAVVGKAARPPVSATDRRRAANRGLPPNPKKGASKAAEAAAAAAAAAAAQAASAVPGGSESAGAPAAAASTSAGAATSASDVLSK
jgi:hypothetical protein